jgi:tetratricopeptide (TPR) repeat protein
MDTDAAIAACKAALKAHPGTPRYLYQLGRALVAARRYDEALPHLRSAVEAGYPKLNLVNPLV